MTPARVIVTRPAQDAGRWLDALRARGLGAEALPLIAILPVADAPARAALHQARAGLKAGDGGTGAYQAVMFVSGNAVRYFWDADMAVAPVAAGVRAWATGSGTARALVECGWPGARIDAPGVEEQADSEALWARVQSQIQPDARVLIVRGGDAEGRPAGRVWLTRRLSAVGARVETVVAYRRALPVWDAAQQTLACAAVRDGSVWLISSSQAAVHLGMLLPLADQDLQTARAVVTHPRIERAARKAGFGAVVASSGPGLDAVIAAIRSIESFA